MNYEDIFILIPCHSLEDFPTELSDDEAAGLLNAFAVAWHPRLLTSAGLIPSWHRADEPPEMVEDRLVIVPPVCNSWLPGGWIERARREGATVVAGTFDRAEMLKQALATPKPDDATEEEPTDDAAESVDEDAAAEVTEPTEIAESDETVETAGDSPSADAAEPAIGEETASVDEVGKVDEEIVADFLALGTCYLMLELLTRQMHYFSSLDEIHLQREVLAAAEAAMADDLQGAQTHLETCFEVLTENRERFYPVDCYLVDLCLLIPELADENLVELLRDERPANLLLKAADLEQIVAERPELQSELADAWESGTLDIVGGDREELSVPLVPLESLVRDLEQGHAIFRKYFGRTPTTWGRRRYGLSSAMPQVLKKFGYEAALHLVLDDGQYPDEEQSKVRWEGNDGSVIDATARIPLPGDSPASYLRFPLAMSESMEQDHVAMLVFARWPQMTTPWLEDFRRMNRYSPCLGKLITLQDFFDETDTPGRLTSYSAGEYFAPYLVQSVARGRENPVTRFRDNFQRRQLLDAAIWLNALGGFFAGKSVAESVDQAWIDQIEAAGPDANAALGDVADELLQNVWQQAPGALARVIASREGNQAGLLVINPLSFSRTVVVDLSSFQSAPALQNGVQFTQFDDRRQLAEVEVAGSGFVWISDKAQTEGEPEQAAAGPVLAVDTRLRNQFFEVHLNEETGGIGKIKGFGRAPNQISQQLAFRFGRGRKIPTADPDDEPLQSAYSEMVCRSMEITSTGPLLGEIVSTGDIIDQIEHQRLAGFTQTTRVWRHRPVVEVEIEFDVDVMPEGDPWSNYYAVRFAFDDSTASLTRSVLGGAQSFRGERFHSPHYLEIATEQRRTTLLFGGLCFHRKTGLRMVDTILIPTGENRRKFKFQIVIDEKYPMQAALDFLVPPATVPLSVDDSAVAPAGWFFHLGSRNVQIVSVSDLMPIPVTSPTNSVSETADSTDDPAANDSQPSQRGFALRLLETEGRRCVTDLRCFQAPTYARQRDFQGKTIGELTIENDAVKLEVTPYEILDVELRF